MAKILKLQPALKDYIWGGEKLKEAFPTSFERVAEVWVCACHKDGKSIVADGAHRGLPLEEAIGLSPSWGMLWRPFPF